VLIIIIPYETQKYYEKLISSILTKYKNMENSEFTEYYDGGRNVNKYPKS
jgi:hypothetical protein